MDTKSVATGSVALVVILAVIIGAYMYLSGNNSSKALPFDAAYTAPTSVVVTHTQTGGMHIYTGTIPMTSTCNKVGSGISYDEVEGRLKASLAIGILKAEDGACQGVANGTTQSFTTSFTPPHALPVDLLKVTVNGKEVEFTTN